MEHKAWDAIWKGTALLRVGERFFGKLCDYVKPGVILDVGCGTAQTDVALAKVIGQAFIVGTDFSAEALRIAKQRSNQEGVSLNLVMCDVCHLPFRKDVFDVIFSEGVSEHVFKVEVLFAEVKRVLKMGELFIISVPNGISPGDLIWRELLTFKGEWIYGPEHAYAPWQVTRLLHRHNFTCASSFYFEMPRLLKFLDFYKNPLCVRIDMVGMRRG